MEVIQSVMREWYLILSQVSVALSVPVKQVADWVQLPLLTVFLFGLVGSLSPCQLTTNLSAIFALGTVLPLLAFSGLLTYGSDLSTKLVERLKGSQRMISRIAGVVFVLAGINDTLTYWFI